FYQKCYRFFETGDTDWPHMTPIQGDWKISSVDLPATVQRKIYFDNARRIFASSLPTPTLIAARIADDFMPDGSLSEDAWDRALPQRVESGLVDAKAVPELSVAVRALWSDRFLYLGFEAPYEKLTMADPPAAGERDGLWNDDVVEFFCAAAPDDRTTYAEFEWAPNGETLDLQISPTEKRLAWNAVRNAAVVVDTEAKVWRVEARIAWSDLAAVSPEVGSRLPANFYRHNAATRQFLAWNPTLTRTAHTPARFGWLQLGE
ncbi:MAG: carbohydrate-binding family 9-like protein, partial [Planctomycetales bacterium]|nr:carbohydrate-binding family 9-like protein [Planctomycetales bacterium]